MESDLDRYHGGVDKVRLAASLRQLQGETNETALSAIKALSSSKSRIARLFVRLDYCKTLRTRNWRPCFVIVI